jgi:hypothetical protein
MTNDEENKHLESSQAQDSFSCSGNSCLDRTTTPSSVPANRSAGPRSQRGKNASKRNALKHAIFCKVVALQGESQAEVNYWVIELRKYFKPEGALEDILVDKIAALFWRQRRVVVAEVAAGGFNTNPFNINESLSQMDVLMRYETMFGRAIDRALAQLERAQRIRLGQQVSPRIDLNVSSS